MTGPVARALIIVTVLAVIWATALPLGAESGAAQIEGLHSTYGPKSVVNAVVRNLSSRRIEVNIAVEKLGDNRWQEVFASITDPKHPYGKTVKLIPLDGGAYLSVSFKPLERYKGVSPLSHSSLPLSLRLRVDIYGPHGGSIVDTVWSSVFSVSAEPGGEKLP